jgi:hypothetical protein
MHHMSQAALVTVLFFLGCNVLCVIGFTLDAWSQTRAARSSQRGDRAEAVPASASWRGRRRG